MAARNSREGIGRALGKQAVEAYDIREERALSRVGEVF